MNSAQTFYLDASALVKRYMTETGTQWIESICADEDNYAIAVAEFGLVEVASAFAGKHRGGFISLHEYSQALAELIQDAQQRYRLVRVEHTIIYQAIQLTTRHRLRGYDAIHLACALTLNLPLVHSGMPSLTFVCADDDLLSAAAVEGLRVDNPNQHS